ncbi:MAG: flagellar motor protein [Acidobacteria bacterium]|nr:flagellar motor protein [Acidobacteriota bacterium]
MRFEGKSGAKPDVATLAGLALALCGILGGLILEGGSIQDVAQITAALIVFGGTLGAVVVTTPPALLRRAFGRLSLVLFDAPVELQATIETVVGYAVRARRTGILSLEHMVETIPDPFLSKALGLAVDGAPLEEMRQILELEISVRRREIDAEAGVYEAAGAYAPTVGIIGAVLGLIQVMKHLANIDDVGKGIAVAFVATLYGVASANLFFLPAATRIRTRAEREFLVMEIITEGCVSLAEGLNPRLIRSKLEAYAGPGRAAAPAPRKTSLPEPAAVE